MPEFTIEKMPCYIGPFVKTVTISARENDKNGYLEYVEDNDYENDFGKRIIKKIPLNDYKKLCDEAGKINMLAIFNENLDCLGCDGWTLNFSLQSGFTELKVTLWCPEKDDKKPETKKLLLFCEKVFALCDDERKKANV